ncbi:MAG TPA: recombination protein O N-terminal domain-containing protein [Candidatus Paceibacterota bacterium]
MSYHIYTTEGIILKRKGFGEADLFLHILTKDLGLILASAKSARLSSSKLKGALQEYSTLTVTCIKAKNGWKVTNVRGEGNLFFELPLYTHYVLAQLSSFILKNIVGELPQKEIFEIVKTGFEFLGTLKEEDLSEFEVLFVIRLLHKLGYVVLDSETEKYLKDSTIWDNKLLEVRKDKIKLVGLINKALKESQI